MTYPLEITHEGVIPARQTRAAALSGCPTDALKLLRTMSD